MASPLKIYVMPVSGNFFPIQIGILAAIANANSILDADGRFAADMRIASSREQLPTAVLAASGGNIAAYIGLMSDWERARIYSSIDFLNSDLFLKPWYDALPSWLFLPWAQSVYREGYGFERVYLSVFPKSYLGSRQAAEVWTGTYHRTSGQQRLFVNRESAEDCEIRVDEFCGSDARAIQLGANVAPVYAGSDRVTLARATLASASIPWLVPRVEIHGEEYSDGGGSFASPMSCMSGAVYGASAGGTRTLRMVYMSPLTLSEPRDAKDTIVGEIRNLLHSNYVCDLRIFQSVIVRLGAPEEPESFFDLSPSRLADVIHTVESTTDHYAMALFPNTAGLARDVNLAGLIPDQTRHVMARVEASVAAFLWRAPVAP
jgi:hypothetical protein